jgi:Uma2 family endonuclease
MSAEAGLSLDDWFALPEDEPGELVEGRLEEEEVPDYSHELLVALLGRLLGNWTFPQGDGRRDRVEKTADYAAFGVRWYWLLDPQLRSLEVLELDAQGRYLHVLGASTGTLRDIPGCVGLALDLDALWAAIDDLE